MIELTRLRHGETFLLNPDLIERVDTHVDTVVRLTSGHEYVVVETYEEIFHRIVEYRARVLATVAVVSPLGAPFTTIDAPVDRDGESTPASHRPLEPPALDPGTLDEQVVR